jgi:mycofactocin precursor
MAPVEVSADMTNQTSVAEALVSDDDELLIEEISIDGMCGVY